MKTVVLASNSPRRKELLKALVPEFKVITSNADESFDPLIEKRLIPIEIAKAKAVAVQNTLKAESNNEDYIIIAADTIVVVNDTVLGKPQNVAEATEMLKALSNAKHQVITGVVILDGERVITDAVITDVYFNELSPQDIKHYITTYQPFDKAGSYGIQEWIGMIGIHKIEGDYYNVMGLPVSRLKQLLNL